MKKRNMLNIIIVITALLMISGCENDNPKNLTTSKSITSDVTVVPTITHTLEPSITSAIAPTTMQTLTSIEKPPLNTEEPSLKAYKKFLKNEMKVCFDLFMHKEYAGQALYKNGREYTLSEVLDIIKAHYFEHSANKKIESIDYSYIDCGKDGVLELGLCFGGMDLYSKDDGSTLVYIIKYIDGKLFLCYCYETWARSQTTMNEYGYYQSGGSSGANKHGADYGLIDKNGNWQPIVSIESETDISELSLTDKLGRIHEVAETKGITGKIELDTIYFSKNEKAANSVEDRNKECLYTFNIFDNKWNEIEDANLYTKSIYKEIFDEAKVPFITPDELSAMISKKEAKVGVTSEIKEGKEITWNTLNENKFSEYVGR